MEQRFAFDNDRPVLLIDRLGGRARSGLIVAFAIGFVAFLALLKPMVDGIAWLVAGTSRFFQ